MTENIQKYSYEYMIFQAIEKLSNNKNIYISKYAIRCYILDNFKKSLNYKVFDINLRTRLKKLIEQKKIIRNKNSYMISKNKIKY